MWRFDNGVITNLVYPLVAIVAAFLGAVVLRYFGETRQRRRVTALFSQYVPETVAQRLVDEDRAETAAEGQRLDMTVLFCDLRGFTALSESLPPGTVRIMLDHYYDRVTELVLSIRGTLMKYVGDEVFAVWGAPIPSDDHPAQALACAIAIQELTPELNRELLAQRRARGGVRHRSQHGRGGGGALRWSSAPPVRRGGQHGEHRRPAVLDRRAGVRSSCPTRS